MFTIFTAPRAFNNQFGLIQRNAILSWKKLRPEPEIILLGDDEGIKEVAEEFNVLHVSEIKKNNFGTPLVNDIFEKAQKIAKNNILAYVNADIILTEDFSRAVEKIKENKFLMVGRRTDFDIPNQINFEKTDWQKELLLRAEKEGVLHGPAGIDYFVFPRDLWQKIPSFALGRTVWDNWLLYEASSVGALLIDATPVVIALHQNHTYSHHQKGRAGVWKGEEAKMNLKSAGGDTHFFTIRDVDLVLTPLGFKKPKLTLYRFLSFPLRHFKKIPLFVRIFLSPGWLALVLWRRIKRNLII